LDQYSSGKESAMARRSRPELTPEQKVEADKLEAAIREAAADDIRDLVENLARTTDETIFGDNEFVIRDIVHRIGAVAVETALREREKGGTEVRA
jgi:hypothetical protein